MIRVVLVGASGVFGRRLAAMIAAWPDVQLVLAARRTAPLEALRASLGGRAEVAAVDRTKPETLAALNPWAVIDAAGPFQGAGYGLAHAALAAGAHYIDLADGRDFVAGFEAAIDPTDRTAVTGASSTPALTNAALDRLTQGWKRVDTVFAAISPGAKAPRGDAVARAILSWVGQPVHCFTGGRWTVKPGWSGLRRRAFPGLGRRWTALAETPDLDVLPARFADAREAVFHAGLESPVLQLGTWLLSWLVRLRIVRSLAPAAPLLQRLAGLAAPFGTDRGGMIVEAEGLGPDGQPRQARWALWAEAGAGPNVPAAPAAAVLRALLDGRLKPGAFTCADLVGLDEIMAQLAHLPIATRTDETGPAEGLFPRLLGPAFERLPGEVRAIHHGAAPVRLEGSGVAKGAAGPAALARSFIGLPKPGRHPIEVEITPSNGAETWRRRFSGRGFSTRIGAVPGDPGAFEEAFGPIAFRFRASPCAGGFTWDFEGWRLGPLPLPRVLAPTVRARSFERDGCYRFSVLSAHPLAGVIFAYAGRLRMTGP